MPTAPTLDDLRRLQRDEGQLIRGFELDLRQALIAETDPASVTKTWKGKLDQFLKRCEDLRKAPTTPKAAADLIASIQDDAKKRFDDLADRAKRAHDRRPEVNDKLVRSYDEAMSGALAKAPGQAVQAGHDQIHRAIRQLVESALPQNLVKADQSSSFTQAKNQMSDALSRWVEDQDVVEDAFFVAQSALLDTAQFIQRQLFIQGQIKDLKKWTEGQKTLDAPTNKQVDAQAGQLGKAYVQSDRQGEQAIRRAATIKPELRLDPHFVLDPTKRFLADVNLRAG